jgi:hypothetical protein
MRRNKESVALTELHLRLRQRVHGDDDIRAIHALQLLAYALGRTGGDVGVADAETVLEQALEKSRRVLGEDHEETVSTTKALGNNLLHQYKLTKAEKAIRSVLDWCEKRPADVQMEQIGCAGSMADLSAIVGLQGKAEDGARFAQDAYERLSDLVGPQSHRPLSTLHVLGLNLQWMDRLSDAEHRFQEYLDIATASNQPKRVPKFYLTRVQFLQGGLDATEALPVFERFVTATTEPMQPLHGEIGLTALAQCFVRLGRFEDARQVMDRHPARLMDAVPIDHYERQLYDRTLVEIDEGLALAGQGGGAAK